MISHHHETIFVHVPRTAGQSIERVFLDDLGLSWQQRDPLLLRKNDLESLGPPRLAHLTAQEYYTKKWIPRRIYDEYFTFSFVRNPWDRMVSFYRYKGHPWRESFSSFVQETFVNKYWEEQYYFIRPQCEYLIGPNGDIDVDFIGRFENLDEDWKTVAANLDVDHTLPHANKSNKMRSEFRPTPLGLARWLIDWWREYRWNNNTYKRYEEYYSEVEVDIVRKYYHRDIETFGYNFGE